MAFGMLVYFKINYSRFIIIIIVIIIITTTIYLFILGNSIHITTNIQ